MLDYPTPVVISAETSIQDMDTCFRRYDEEERAAESSQEGRARVATSIGRPRDFPNPKFVEPVETNPEVTPAFAPTPGPLTMTILLYVIPYPNRGHCTSILSIGTAV